MTGPRHIMDTTWDEADPGDGPRAPHRARGPVVNLDTLDDGRCHATTWAGARKPPRAPTYENHFGPGGYNRCIGSEGHANPLHKDEWGHVFSVDEDGAVTQVRRETPTDRQPVEA
jgi:hypothetical protein